MRTKHPGISLLQEIHSQEIDVKTWEKEWGGKIIFSHGTTQCRGVAVLLPQNLVEKCKISNIERDQNGRTLTIDWEIEGNNFTMFNIYAPTKDQYREQMQFVERLRNLLQQKQGQNQILSGDFTHNWTKKVGSVIQSQTMPNSLNLFVKSLT